MVRRFDNENQLYFFLKDKYIGRKNLLFGDDKIKWDEEVKEASRGGPYNLPESANTFIKTFSIFDSYKDPPIHEERYLSILNDFINDKNDGDGGNQVYNLLSEKVNDINIKYEEDMKINPPQDGWPWDEDDAIGGGYKSLSSKRINSKRRNSKRRNSKRRSSKRRSSKRRNSKRRNSKRKSSKRRSSKRRSSKRRSSKRRM